MNAGGGPAIDAGAGWAKFLEQVEKGCRIAAKLRELDYQSFLLERSYQTPSFGKLSHVRFIIYVDTTVTNLEHTALIPSGNLPMKVCIHRIAILPPLHNIPQTSSMIRILPCGEHTRILHSLKLESLMQLPRCHIEAPSNCYAAYTDSLSRSAYMNMDGQWMTAAPTRF